MKLIRNGLLCVLALFFLIINNENLVYADSGEIQNEQIEENGNDDSSYCTVIFFLCGGEYNNVDDEIVYNVEKNTYIEEPEISLLEKGKCSFVGWYTIDNEEWVFDENIVDEDLNLYAKWDIEKIWLIGFNKDESFCWQNKEIYLQEKYGIYDSIENFAFMYDEHKVEEISDKNPIEMYSGDFPQKDIKDVLTALGIGGDYAGCGPVAMLGILDYFSRSLGYFEIIDDPTSSAERQQLVTDVLNIVKTYQVGFVDEKQTYTFPADYVSAMNNILEKYGLSDKITVSKKNNAANDYDTLLSEIIKSIDKGIPVTLYHLIGASGIANHYMTIYGYQKCGVEDIFGEVEDTYFLLVRPNYGTDADFYVDAKFLSVGLATIIYYNIQPKHSFCIAASEFSTKFINPSTGQGQYYFEEKSATIYSSMGFIFGTKRLRCSYIENEYLVLSANRENAGMAYLEFDLYQYIKKLTIDISLWGPKEYLEDGRIYFEYYDSVTGRWDNHRSLNPNLLNNTKDALTTYTLLFPKNIDKVKLVVIEPNPQGSWNKGRVVIDNITFGVDYNKK